MSWRARYGDIVDVRVRGVNYRLGLADNVTDSKIFAASKIYDGRELSALARAAQGGGAEGGVFVDIGANTGYYTLSLARMTGCKVLAIEPNPVTVDRLVFNIAANPDLAPLIAVARIGIGPVGKFELHFEKSLGGASVNKELFGTHAKSVTIQTRPLLELLESRGITGVHALKIDIEGAEDQALMPFFEQAPEALWPKTLIIEDAHSHLWTLNVEAALKRAGYSLSARNGGNAIWKR